MRWVVQEYQAATNAWKDIRNLEALPPLEGSWEADNADSAFSRAVMQNDEHRINGTSYRILPLDGGITFNVRLHVDAQEHAA